MLSFLPPRRRLVAACRLGLSVGMAAMLSPSPPRHPPLCGLVCRSGSCVVAAVAPSPPRRRPRPRRVYCSAWMSHNGCTV
eukprot:94396-Pyramimonas_sp.AAC.1